MSDLQHAPRIASTRLAAYEAQWRRFGVHRASQHAFLPTTSSGWPALDRLLPGGGYPLGAVTEWLTDTAGIGELTLLLACLKARLAAWPRKRVALVSPPYQLNAPALAGAGIDLGRLPVLRCRDAGERLWSVEQMARSNAFAAFVVWGDDLNDRALRRLQLAAEHAVCPIFVCRGLARGKQRSPAALRLAITCRDGRQQLKIIKCRGPAGAMLPGLAVSRDTGWSAPATAPAGLTTRTACNDPDDENDHVACSTFSPLGAR